MALYDRLLGRTDAGVKVAGKIPMHQFMSIIGEQQRGKITAAQANTMQAAISGGPALDAGELAEVATLIATVPSGATAANQAARALRLLEIEQILYLGDVSAAGYDTPTAVKSKLGV